MSKYEHVSDEYAAQLHELAATLTTGREFEPPRQSVEDWAEKLPMPLGRLAVEGCPADEAYPRCGNCPGDCDGRAS